MSDPAIRPSTSATTAATHSANQPESAATRPSARAPVGNDPRAVGLPELFELDELRELNPGCRVDRPSKCRNFITQFAVDRAVNNGFSFTDAVIRSVTISFADAVISSFSTPFTAFSSGNRSAE